MNHTNSKNTGTNVQDNTFARGATYNMQWDKEQLEILLQCHEELVANEQWCMSLPESHDMACNCTECN